MTTKTYLVGGSVRDMIMGIEPKDKDYVIVGATSEDEKRMLAEGWEKVGADFAVYLHPETKDEYALARKERKTGHGYQAFEFDTNNVTLEEDLSRRDLTANSIAMCLDTGEIIDPFNGRQDIKDRVLRNTTLAFREDPLRVFRVAKFASRYNFTVAPETMVLMKQIVEAGEIEHLAKERLMKEMLAIVANDHAEYGFRVLQECGALEKFCSFFTFDECIVKVLSKNVSGAHEKLGYILGICAIMSGKFTENKQIEKVLIAMTASNEMKQMAIAAITHHPFEFLQCSEEDVLKRLKSLHFYQQNTFNMQYRELSIIEFAVTDHDENQLDRIYGIFDDYAKLIKAIDGEAIALKYTINGKVDGKAIAQEIKETQIAVIKQYDEQHFIERN